MNVPFKYDSYELRYNNMYSMKPGTTPEKGQEEVVTPENKPEAPFIPLSGEEIKSSLDVLDKMGRAMVDGGCEEKGGNVSLKGPDKAGDNGDETWNHYQNLRRSFMTEIERYISGNSNLDPHTHHKLIVSIGAAMIRDLDALEGINYEPSIICALHFYDTQRKFIASQLEALNAGEGSGSKGDVDNGNLSAKEIDGPNRFGNTSENEITLETLISENAAIWGFVTDLLEHYSIAYEHPFDQIEDGSNNPANLPRLEPLYELRVKLLGEPGGEEILQMLNDRVKTYLENLDYFHQYVDIDPETGEHDGNIKKNKLKHPMHFGIWVTLCGN